MKKSCLIPRAFLTLLTALGGLAANAEGDSTKLLPWKIHLQSRYSPVEGKVLGVWGGSVGYVWGPYQRELTLGYHWLGRRGSRQLGQIEKQIAREAGLDSYDFVKAGFVNVGYWHIIYNSPRWKWGFPIELGLGKATSQPYSLLDEPLAATSLRATVLPLQLGGYGEWKATRWVGFGPAGRLPPESHPFRPGG